MRFRPDQRLVGLRAIDVRRLAAEIVKPAVTTLDVYLGAELVGKLRRQAPTRYAFEYTEAAVSRYGEGAIVLSASLPVSSARYPNAKAKPFFEGLLPEQGVRSAVARQLGLSPGNSFGILSEIGLDCAGAVMFVREGEPQPDVLAGSIEWLDEPQLGQRLRDLPRSPLGISPREGVRLSLGGVQDKMVVTKTGSQIGLPQGGTPSSHLIKPTSSNWPDLVANESFCLRTLQSAGLDVAATEVTTIDGVVCLVVERYDRTLDETGRRIRLHQEDFCQALRRLPDAKYEHEGGPTVAEIVQLLRDLGGSRLVTNLTRFFSAVVANFILGNSDAHSKNYSILYDREGWPTLTPLYDVVCTAAYPDLTPQLAMSIGGISDPNDVTLGSFRRLGPTAASPRHSQPTARSKLPARSCNRPG